MTPPDSGSVVAERATSRTQELRPIHVGFADYDRTRPLVDGRVKARGIALKTTVKWTYLYLYVLLDIFSRYVV